MQFEEAGSNCQIFQVVHLVIDVPLNNLKTTIRSTPEVWTKKYKSTSPLPNPRKRFQAIIGGGH
jgi:hypothetical protein